MKQIYSICIVDDHDIVRQGLRNVFTLEYGFEVVGEAASSAEAKTLLQTVIPDVLILDQMLGDGSGIQLAYKLKPILPHTEIVLLTAFPVSEEDKRNLKKQNVNTVIYKDQSSFEIRKAVMQALGYNYESTNHKENNSSLLEDLSHREKEILLLISRGLQNKEISSEIGISEKTVRNTISSIFKKLGVGNRTEATLKFLE
jgi:two-component system, NarL family, response regulator DevR